MNQFCLDCGENLDLLDGNKDYEIFAKPDPNVCYYNDDRIFNFDNFFRTAFFPRPPFGHESEISLTFEPINEKEHPWKGFIKYIILYIEYDFI